MSLRKKTGAIALALCMTLQLLSGAAWAAEVATVAITIRAPMTGSSVAASMATPTQASDYTVTTTTWKTGDIPYTGETFAKETVYTATVTLTATVGNPFTDAAMDAITLTGTEVTATGATLNTGKTVLTFDVMFPATGKTVAISAVTIKGTPSVGKVLSLDVLDPKGATVSYQWQRSGMTDGIYENIANQTANTYTVMVGDIGSFLRLQVTGSGDTTGSAVSASVEIPSTTVPTITAFVADKSTLLIGETVTFTLTAAAVTDGTLKYAVVAGTTEPTLEEMKALTFTPSNVVKVNPSTTASYRAVVKNERVVAEQDVSAYAAFPIKVDITVKQPLDTAMVTLSAPVTGGTPGMAILPVGTTGYSVTRTTWAPMDKPFKSGVSYTATVGLTASATHLFTSKVAAANAITVDGATAINHAIVDGDGARLTFEVVFPAAGTPVTAVTIENTGKVYTAKATTPPTATVNYQWQYGETVDGNYTNIPRATVKNYTAVKEYEGKFIRLMVVGNGTFSGVAYSAGMKIPVTLGGMVAITGIAQFGKELTADLSGVLPAIKVADATYQWTRKGVKIDTATKSTYTLVKEDIGQEIRVIVTGVAPDYTGTLTSAAVTAERADAVAPSGLGSMLPTLATAIDGKITGLKQDILYECMLAGNAYKAVTPLSTEITGLASGVYSVRFAQTDTHKPSAGMTVIISNFGAATLGGAVSTQGSAIYGNTLTAKPALTQGQLVENTMFAWYRDGAEVSSGVTYALTATDVGKAITLKVLGKGALTGTLEITTAVVAKADPVLTLNAADLAQYTNNLRGVGATLAPVDASAKIIVEYLMDKTWKSWEDAKITTTGTYNVRAYTLGGDGVKPLVVGNAKTGTLIVTSYSGGGGGGGGATPSTPNITKTTTTNKDGTKIVTSVNTRTGEITAAITVPKNVTSTRVTILVPKVTPGTVAAIVNADGSPTIIRKSIMESGGITILLSASADIKILDNSKRFPDTTGHWATDSVLFVTARELFNGTSDNSFSPEMPMNRSMLATILYRLERGKPGSSNQFSDVPSGMYYSDAVAWATQNGIVTGISQNQFGPEDNITRESLAAMLYRYAKTAGLSADKTGSISRYPDGAAVSDWAVAAMDWAIGMGILTGDDSGNLNPAGQANRAEVSTMLQRFIAKL